MSGHKSLSGDYYSEDDLRSAGFRSIGTDVKIHERANIFGAEHISIGDHVRIDQFANVVATSPIGIGSYIHIAAFCHMSVSCGLTIGSFSAFGVGSKIFTSSSDFDGHFLPLPLPCISLRAAKGCRCGAPSRSRDTHRGHQRIDSAGCDICRSSAVGAMCVVQESLQPWTSMVGARRGR